MQPSHQYQKGSRSYFILIPLPLPTDLTFYKNHQNYILLLLDSLREALILSDREPTIVCDDGPIGPGIVPVRVDHPHLLDLADEQVRRGLISRAVSVVLGWVEGFEGDGEVPDVLAGWLEDVQVEGEGEYGSGVESGYDGDDDDSLVEFDAVTF